MRESARWDREASAGTSTALEARQSFFRQVTEASACGIMIIDTIAPGRPIVYVNPAFCRITGYAAIDLLARSWDAFFTPEIESHPQVFHRAVQWGGEAHGILRARHKNGAAL